MIKVLIVDDDSAVRGRLRRLLTAAGDIAVVGEAGDGATAVSMVGTLSPDVVVMDTEMPGMDGYQAAEEIMIVKPTPVIMISPYPAGARTALGFRAIEVGAVAVLALPGGNPQTKRRRESELVQTVRAMSEIAVIHRKRPRAPLGRAVERRSPAPAKRPDVKVDLVAIGASTGGPQALQTILSELPRTFDAAVIVVQHITPEFQDSFVSWLSVATGVTVRVPSHGEQLERGQVYVAPQWHQVGVDAGRRVVLSDGPPENGVLPAISFLFRSLTTAMPRRTVAALLTGMGRDGAAELLELRNQGALTIAQSEESSVVNGMPGEAIRLGAAERIMAPAEIGRFLRELLSPNGRPTAEQPVTRA
jgi:two-component system, chemotaxis family, protein-glutamate methylesterase/glutaminase